MANIVYVSKKNIVNISKKLEQTSYVVNYKYLKGNDFESNLNFLIETLVKPISLIIEEKDISDKINIINKEIKIYVVISNNDKYDRYDNYYLNY